jgi:hypothetical protein
MVIWPFGPLSAVTRGRGVARLTIHIEGVQCARSRDARRPAPAASSTQENCLRTIRTSEHRIDRWVANVQHGRFERSLSGLTAFAAAVTTAEIYLEHYRASVGNKMMWSPIIVTPPVMVAGIGGVFSRRWAKTYLPVTAIIYTANGLIGEYYHARGVARRPGGFKQASYNLAMGPPIMAPGLMTIVGFLGVLAAVLRRED